MVSIEGLWPGVAAITADADMHCLDCARSIYGGGVIQVVIDGNPGWDDWKKYADHEGNPFGVVLADSEDLNGEHCGDCGEPLYNEEEGQEDEEDEEEDEEED